MDPEHELLDPVGAHPARRLVGVPAVGPRSDTGVLDLVGDGVELLHGGGLGRVAALLVRLLRVPDEGLARHPHRGAVDAALVAGGVEEARNQGRVQRVVIEEGVDRRDVPLRGKVEETARLGEQCHVGGVAGAHPLLDGCGEVLIGRVLDGDPGLFLEGGERGQEGLLLLTAEGAEDADGPGTGDLSLHVLLPTTSSAASAGRLGVLQASGHAERGRSGRAPGHDRAPTRASIHGSTPS